MILSMINAFVLDVAEKFNINKSTTLQLRQSDFLQSDFSDTPVNQSDLYYYVGVDSTDFLADERKVFEISGRIELCVMVGNRNYVEYKSIVDLNLYNLFRHLSNEMKYQYSNVDVSQTIELLEFTKLSLNNATRIDKEYYMPTIEYSIRYYDEAFTLPIYTENIL